LRSLLLPLGIVPRLYDNRQSPASRGMCPALSGMSPGLVPQAPGLPRLFPPLSPGLPRLSPCLYLLVVSLALRNPDIALWCSEMASWIADDGLSNAWRRVQTRSNCPDSTLNAAEPPDPLDPYSTLSEGMSAASNPYDAASRTPAQVQRMQRHLAFHRAGLCDALSDAAIRYASEIYPVGDGLSTDCTRVAFAVFTFLVGTSPRQYASAHQPLLGLPCPAQAGATPLVHYICLAADVADPFDTSAGHRLVVLQAGSRVRILNAFQGLFTLAEFACGHPSMPSAEFSTWWGELQAALGAPNMPDRATRFTSLIGAALDQPVGGSWILTRSADLSG
jgi:hypothetical protein